MGGNGEKGGGDGSRFVLSPENAGRYLVARGVLDALTPLEVRLLGGGISNVVLCATQRGRSVVVKQALERLRVEDDWRARPERAVAEAEALALAGGLTPGAVPEVIDVDERCCALTISAAPAGWRSWKDELLSGIVEPAVAARLGELLAVWHTTTAGDSKLARAFASSEAFEELRIDPYYLTVARRRPELAGALGELVGRLRETKVCLVHGDYSPKNVLVGEALWVIDFEVAHYGDPAFDPAFMLNHLFLKRLHLPGSTPALESCAEEFWGAYERASLPLRPDVAYVLAHVGALMVARIEGKSPVEYLSAKEREDALRIGEALISKPPGSVREALEVLDAHTSTAQGRRGGTR
jgi:hypothetical protein